MRWKQRKRVTPDISIWKPYFCWFPVLINGQYVWLEIVLRRTRIQGIDYDLGGRSLRVLVEYCFKS